MSDVDNFLARARVLMGDQEGDEFTDEEYFLELQAALLELNSEIQFYVRSESIPMCESKITYELPSDCMKLDRLRLDGPRGSELPLYEENDIPDHQDSSLVRGGNSYFPFNRRDYGFVGQVAIRDDSANAFSLNKTFTAEDVDSLPADGVWGS